MPRSTEKPLGSGTFPVFPWARKASLCHNERIVLVVTLIMPKPHSNSPTSSAPAARKTPSRMVRRSSNAKPRSELPTPSAPSATTPSSDETLSPVGVTPQKVAQKKRRQKRSDRARMNRYMLASHFITCEAIEPNRPWVVLAKTPHVYRVMEAREDIARDSLIRLAQSMGANALLGVTVERKSEWTQGKLFRRIEVRGVPALLGEPSRSPGAQHKEALIQGFPKSQVVRAYHRRLKDREALIRRIRYDEGIDANDQRLGKGVIWAALLIFGLMAVVTLFSH